MKGVKILILDADSRAGLSSLQSLGRHGHEVHAAVRARRSSTEYSRWCHLAVVQPGNVPIEEALAWLLDVHQQFNYGLIIPSTDTSLLWVSSLPPEHPVRAKAVIPADWAIDAALDKEKTYVVARELGIPLPPSRMLESGKPVPIATGFPLVLKPVRTTVLAGPHFLALTVAIVRNEHERERAIAARLPFSNIQEQSWVRGRGVGVEVLYDRGRMVCHFIHERLHELPLTGGASTLRRAAEKDPVLLDYSRRLLDALDWHGAAMVEWRRDRGGESYLIEVNPRLWGSLPLTVAAGVDVPLGLLALATGQPFSTAPSWRAGLTARNLSGDLRWCLKNACTDRSDPLLLTEPILKSIIGWFRIIAGREVWDGWSLADPIVAVHEVISLVRELGERISGRARRFQLLYVAKRRHRRIVARGSATGSRVKRVLFVCLGNICRTPFAAAAASAYLPDVEVDSAGFHPSVDRPSPVHVIEAASALHIDLSQWRSRRVTANQIAAAELIVVMDLSNLQQMAEAFPEAIPRTTLLGLFAPSGPAEIVDPYLLSSQDTELVLRQVLQAVDALGCWIRRINSAVRRS